MAYLKTLLLLIITIFLSATTYAADCIDSTRIVQGTTLSIDEDCAELPVQPYLNSYSCGIDMRLVQGTENICIAGKTVDAPGTYLSLIDIECPIGKRQMQGTTTCFAIDADYMSSYENSKTSLYIDYYILDTMGLIRHAIAYLDAEGDGDIDVFIGTGKWLEEGEFDSILFINDGSENFSSSTTEFSGDMPPATHARKTLVSDFNADGLKDMLILDHGYDALPFPGSQLKLVMQDTLGTYSWTKFPEVGYYHGGAAADIDKDGDIDIFVGDHQHLSGNYPHFYVNDGNGNFTKNSNIFDNSMYVIYSAELIDVDNDGYIDLLVGGHEREGAETSIYWGSSTVKYTASNRTIIPVVPHMGVILDFDAEDIDGDGDRDLIVNRTRDGDDGGGLGYYVGRATQLMKNNGNRNFTDITSTNIDNPGGDTDQWFEWLRVQDFDGDGDMDIRPDNANFGFEYLNDGIGNFTKSTIVP